MEITGQYPKGKERGHYIDKLVNSNPKSLADMRTALRESCDLYVLCDYQCYVQQYKLTRSVLSTTVSNAKYVIESLERQVALLKPFIATLIKDIDAQQPQTAEVRVAVEIESHAETWKESFTRKQRERQGTKATMRVEPTPQQPARKRDTCDRMFLDPDVEGRKKELHTRSLEDILDFAAQGLANTAIHSKLEEREILLSDITAEWEKVPRDDEAITKLINTYIAKGNN